MKQKIRKPISITLILTLFVILLMPAFRQEVPAAETVKYNISAKELDSGRMVTLINMPYNASTSIKPVNYENKVSVYAMQNFAFTPDGEYILAISTGKENGQTHSVLSRCLIPEPPAEDEPVTLAQALTGPCAKCEEVMILPGFGHSDSLSIVQSDPEQKVYQLWVSCSPAADGYGTDIARLTYEIDEFGRGNITKTVYLTNFKKANTKKGKAAYFSERQDATWLQVATDADSNQVVFRTRLSVDESVHYLSYNLRKLNRILDKEEDGAEYNIAKAAELQKAHVRYFNAPRMSFQSFDVKGKNLYIAGGNNGIGFGIDVVRYSTQASGEVVEQIKDLTVPSVKIISTEPKIRIFDAIYDKDYLEIEGVKVEKTPTGKTEYYISFNCSIPRVRDTTSIYKIVK